MKKNKGFTLIELLAVIVVLAIIALIAIPVILGIVDKAKAGAAKSSVLGYIDAVEKQVALNQLDKTKEKITAGDYDFAGLTSKGVKIKGEIDSASVTISDKGTVTSGEFCVNDYSIKYENNKATISDTNYCNGSGSDEVVLTGNSISSYVETLLSNNSGNTYSYMGGTYLKGAQTNNYVWYNGFLWRIMGKNSSDKTIRLITEENVIHSAQGQATTYGTNIDYINDWLNKYFYTKIDNKKNGIIKNSNWCVNITESSTSNRTDCTGGTLVSAKVGLISLDEYNLSGASSTNKTYSLSNAQYFWTITPSGANTMWVIDQNASPISALTALKEGVRPVINVDENAIITSGDGTLSNAYVLNQTIDEKTGRLTEKASVGEYISLLGKKYRLVSKDSAGVKLIYDGYYEEPAGTKYRTYYNQTTNDFTFTTESGIGQKLNTDVLTWLGNSPKIVKSNWYQRSYLLSENTYVDVLNSTDSPVEAKVGLIRVGEMLSGQSASILTNGYESRSAFANLKSFWTMNRYSSASDAWISYWQGDAATTNSSSPNFVRPVIVVNNNTTISGGNGTFQIPYIID